MRKNLIIGAALAALTIATTALAWPPPPGRRDCKSISKTYDDAGLQVSETWKCGDWLTTCGGSGGTWNPSTCWDHEGPEQPS